MSLTHEQRYILEELREYLRRVEKMAAQNHIDLDDLVLQFTHNGFMGHLPENGFNQERANKRKEVFSKAGREESQPYFLDETDQ